MRYSASTLIAATTLLAGSISAAPAIDDADQHRQITFGAGESTQWSSDVLDVLATSKYLINEMTGNFGNVVKEGTQWVKEHVNDPRCKLASA